MRTPFPLFRRLLMLVSIVGLLMVLVRGCRALWSRKLQVVAVAGESMTPELEPGDFLVLRRGRPPLDVIAGRIVASRDHQGRLLLKRVVGLPGEMLRVGAVVEVNSRTLREPYANGETPTARYRGVQRLGAGELFLVGDNRAASTDSRDFGPVCADRVEGVAVARYWPPRRIGLIRGQPRHFLAP